jgi:hypothetical protein
MFGDLSQQTFDLLNKADFSSLNKTNQPVAHQRRGW